MNYEQIRTAVSGIFAYDDGAVCSGTRDEGLRSEVIAHISSLEDLDHRTLIARLVIDLCLSPESLELGYGPEDAAGFLQWCDNQGILLSPS